MRSPQSVLHMNSAVESTRAARSSTCTVLPCTTVCVQLQRREDENVYIPVIQYDVLDHIEDEECMHITCLIKSTILSRQNSRPRTEYRAIRTLPGSPLLYRLSGKEKREVMEHSGSSSTGGARTDGIYLKVGEVEVMECSVEQLQKLDQGSEREAWEDREAYAHSPFILIHAYIYIYIHGNTCA